MSTLQAWMLSLGITSIIACVIYVVVGTMHRRIHPYQDDDHLGNTNKDGW